jgi:crotonobetainyl-CoA:carnitine CoA-transferase CaiB-like acyl-CoA transferase
VVNLLHPEKRAKIVSDAEVRGPLDGIRILDLSRILAGPTCTQLLGDLGADVIKIERTGAGDDTRQWGPPYVTDAAGENTTESAYYLCANRNKRSVEVDISQDEGQALVRRLSAHCDVFIENFKVGGLKKYGLSWEDLKHDHPGLIYCSISGFGQDGPYARRPGYDFMIQAMGGIMSITGQPDGDPTKVGVGIADVMCGMYASSAILAALHHRTRTGRGQYIDLGLLDCQVAWLINAGLNYLTSGETPARMGNGHPNIVPYEVFPASDGYFALAVGNDAQYARFCEFAGAPELARDPRFATNELRVKHRTELVPRLRQLTVQRDCGEWLEGLGTVGVPCGPVNDIRQVFDDPQVRHRGMRIAMAHPLAGSGDVDLIGNPLHFSETPVSYRRPPPVCGEHTDEVLGELLGLDQDSLDQLRARGII